MTPDAQSTANPSPAAQTDWIGVGLIALSALCFSASILFVRAVPALNAPSLTFYRALFAFLFFLLIMIHPRFREPLRVGAYRPQVRLLLALGLVMALTATLYTYAIQHTTAANAALLVNSAPIYVALLAPWLLGEPRPRYTWPSVGLAILGILFIAGPGGLRLEGGELGGLVAGVGSGVGYAMPMLIGRHLRGRVSGITQIVWGSGVAALLLAPFALLGDVPAALAALPTLVALGVISLGLSYFLMFLGLRRISAQVVSVVALLEPVSGAVIGLLVFGELFTPLGAVGSVLVLLSIVLIAR